MASTAALEGDVVEFYACLFADEVVDEGVRTGGVSPARLDLAGPFLGVLDEVLHGFPRCVGPDGDQEIIVGKVRDGGEILVGVLGFAQERGGQEARRGGEPVVGVALFSRDIGEGDGPAAAGPVDDRDRLGAELFLFDDALDEPGLDVTAPAGRGVADEFDGLGQWTLGLGTGRRDQEKG